MAKCLQQLFFTLLLVCLTIFQLQAQEKCGTMAKHEDLMSKDAAYRATFEQTEVLIQKQKSLRQADVQGVVYKIPVVVHIMHVGESLGTGTNITDDQIYSAITSLNDAYRKKAGTIYDGNGVDLEIEFCLAQKDPSGNPTTGINRINAGAANASYATDGITDPNEFDVKALSKWDNTKYYNIWVVSQIDGNGAGGGTQGYAYLGLAPSDRDGMVVLYNSFGYDPQGSRGYNLKSYTNKNITTIHEVGHSLGLYHTFQGDGTGSTCPTNNNCNTDGDKVCDTPPHMRSTSNCVTGTNSCDGGSSRELFIHNYMDYSSDDCQTEFTAGQAARARAVLSSARANLVSTSNLTACGCSSNTAPIARFYTNNVQPCEGIPVTFIDESINAPDSYNWTFQGGTPATSTDQNPVVSFSGSGPYNVSLTVTSASSQTNTATKTAYIEPIAGYSGTFPMTESFEGTFPPTNWSTVSSDANTTWGTDGTKQWEKRTVAGSGAGTAAAGINMYNYNISNRIDDLIMPVLNFTDVNNPSLSFALAYRYYGVNNADTLMVLISTDCGNTFTQLYKKGGANLSVGGTLTSPLTPSTAGDWRTETVSLSAYAGQHVQLRFRSISDYGNNLYIDNVNITATYNPPVANFMASKLTGVSPAETVTFTDASTGLVNTYSWDFGSGASPATAVGIGPHSVTYSTIGTKTISLTVTGPGGTDVETKTNYITVSDPAVAPTADFVASKTSSIVVSEQITFTDASTGSVNTYSWDFGSGASPATAIGIGPHQVSYTTSGLKTISLSLVGPGGSDVETKTDYVLISNTPLSVQSAENLGIKIYPNPTKDLLYIDLQDQEEVTVDVMSTISNQVLKTQKGNSSLTVDLSGQPQGLYIIVIKTNKGNVVSRVAKAN